LARLRAGGLADRVCLSDPIPGSYDILSRVKPDLICLGYDQDSLEENLRSWLESRQSQIPLLRLERRPGGYTDDSAGEFPGCSSSSRPYPLPQSF
jgi:glycerol-3-phosphate cytidylyltransferase-like family protein